LGLATYRFAKRQKTWFKRWEKQGREINWVNNIKEAEKLIKNWL
jgi:tRNA A37 N6-isopentenylltransferase MiaA